MKTTLIGQKRHSGQQEMGETREPMARDCWADANRLAEKYSKHLKHDFWVLYAAKPHAKIPNAVVCGWEVIARRPPQGMVGVMVFKWSHLDQCLTVDTELSLPYDVPLSDEEMSKNRADYAATLANAAKKSNSILLA